MTSQKPIKHFTHVLNLTGYMEIVEKIVVGTKKKI
jgi:hypothetical protein